MSVLHSLDTWRTRRRTTSRLRSMSDSQLIDMGIPRWRIDDVVRGAPIDPKLVR